MGHRGWRQPRLDALAAKNGNYEGRELDTMEYLDGGRAEFNVVRSVHYV
jgi:hypothetical protein